MNALAFNNKNWQAHLELRFQAGEDKTNLVPVKRFGPLSVQRPFYPESNLCHSYLLHPPGGVVGGDRLDLKIRCENHSAALVTMPGANKFYQSGGQVANVAQAMDIHPHASFEFLPQENIYFPGARVNARTQLSIAQDASVIFWEKHCFGRPANQEQFASGQVNTRLDVTYRSDLLFTETQRINNDEIQRSSGLRGNPVMGTMLIASDLLDKSLVESCREVVPERGDCGVTRPAERLLLVRFIGDSTLELNAYFVKLWETIRPTVLQRAPSHPRIWNT